ncbi:hypothetical protein PTKIN_Ptkin14bG0172500 [Pterospermum kingtungense]
MKGLLHLYFVFSFLLILSFNSSAPTQLCPRDQSFALIQFNNSLSFDFWCDTDTYYKKKTISWKEGTNCCTWDGVKCETETGNVIGLDLSFSCLSGTISSNSTLFLLHHLQELNLDNNDFSWSPIASEFGQFTNLTHLNISASGFAGTIPLEISHLSKLVSLDLSDNGNLIFEGHVFEKVLGNLTKLQHLLLDTVNMSSVVPTSFLNMSSYITTLTLGNNELQGKFPVDIFRFPCLQKLSLKNNEVLEIDFPKSNWSAPLRSLEVSRVNASLGEVPDSIGNLKSLEVLDLSYSNLKGSIPASLVNLTRLNYLDLHNNLIHGPILFSFSNFRQLSYLDLSDNNLVGPITDSFENLTQLFHLSMSSNQFSGLIFEGHVFEKVLGNLTQLQHLLLDEVDMSSVVPTSFLNMSSYITTLTLGGGLQGKFPVAVFCFPSLQKLGLTSNEELEVDFPKSNWSVPLRSLEVSFVNASLGEVPDSIGNLKSLEVLDLSYSNLKGSIPASLVNLTRLNYLDLHHNLIHGPILFSFSNFKQLSYLDLSDNNLVGPITDSFENLTKLFHLSLGYNQFSGPLPFSVFNLPEMEFLDFSGNKFVGPLPNHVSGLSRLPELDLDSNFLSGKIPSWLFSLPSLVRLDLKNNKFTGPIEQFHKVVPLEMVELENNEIHGPIPSFSTLVNLTYLDLSSNKLNGLFELDKNLSKLLQLYLSNNSFISLTSGSNANYSLPTLFLIHLSSCNVIEVPDVLRNLPGHRGTYVLES